MNQFRVLASCGVFLALSWSCARQTAIDTRGSDERAIREIELEWSKAAATKDVERYSSFYANDAVSLAPGSPLITGKEAIRKGENEYFALPGVSLSFQPAKVVVSRGGDLAYAYGTYAQTLNDRNGKPVNDRGKFVTIFRHEPDGKWKAVVDIFNSDLSAPVPETK